MIEIIGNKIFLDNDYEIREYYTENGIVRALISNECTQSLMYIDKDKRSILGLDYFKYYNIPIDLKPNGVEYLMLGGGTLSYPHHYLNSYINKKIDIVEISDECIEYAKKYFYLEELKEENYGRLNIIIDDAIKYISHANKQYDYVLIDLFNGREPINKIYDQENIINLKRILKHNGIVVINYIINDNNYKKILNKIVKITKYYKIITNKQYFNNISNIGNIIIILSNDKIIIPNQYEYIDVTNNII